MGIKLNIKNKNVMFGIKDKRIVYALLGGAALAVGTAAYFHLNS